MKAYINGKLFADKIILADRFITRLVGLLNKKNLNEGEGLLLKNCSSIHCFFMKFTIDVIYLSKDMQVLYIETVKPWRIGKIVKNCYHVLEVSGAANGISVGDYIEFLE